MALTDSLILVKLELLRLMIRGLALAVDSVRSRLFLTGAYFAWNSVKHHRRI
jgi:hypothetical protein